MAADIKSKPAGDAAPMMIVDTKFFVKRVTSSNEFEIRSRELALQNADDAGLNDAAKMIIADHKKADGKLKKLADAKKIEVPAAAEFAPKHQKMLN